MGTALSCVRAGIIQYFAKKGKTWIADAVDLREPRWHETFACLGITDRGSLRGPETQTETGESHPHFRIS